MISGIRNWLNLGSLLKMRMLKDLFRLRIDSAIEERHPLVMMCSPRMSLVEHRLYILMWRWKLYTENFKVSWENVLTLRGKRILNLFVLAIPNMLMSLIIRFVGIVVCLDIYSPCVLNECTCGAKFLLMWKIVYRKLFPTSLNLPSLLDLLKWYGSRSLKWKLDRVGHGGIRCFMDYWLWVINPYD